MQDDISAIAISVGRLGASLLFITRGDHLRFGRESVTACVRCLV